jgi:NAD-dependent DNA ligase
MSHDWARQGAIYRSEFNQSLAQLVGVATGLIADRVLADAEIYLLRDWIATHDAVAYDWPGNIIRDKVQGVLADGVITDAERTHLLKTLDDLVGCKPETVAAATHVNELAFDDVQEMTFSGRGFCLTGDFIYGPREVCEGACAMRGGIVKSSPSKKTHYVVVGSLGSPAWKFGSFGTKIQKAIELKQAGAPLLIVREDVWSSALLTCAA